MKTPTIFCVTMMFLLAGCIGEESKTQEQKSQSLQYSAEFFPSWNGTSHANQTFVGEQWTNQSAFVAYFSAPWCTHCEPTIDAYDKIIDAELMIVFSRESREEYADMVDWHHRTEQNLNRTIDRPFILLPSLAQEMNVQSIPHAVFVNQQGFVYNVQIGKRTNLTAISELWDLTQQAHFDVQRGWTYTNISM